MTNRNLILVEQLQNRIKPLLKTLLMKQWGRWGMNPHSPRSVPLRSDTLWLFSWNGTVYIYPLHNRLWLWKLGNNYQEATSWQQTIKSLTCSWRNRTSLCAQKGRLFVQLQCPQWPQGALWPLTPPTGTVILLELDVWVHEDSRGWVIDRFFRWRKQNILDRTKTRTGQKTENICLCLLFVVVVFASL